MKPLRTGICHCEGRGFFTLAGQHTPCPSCAGNGPRGRWSGLDEAKERIRLLERRNRRLAQTVSKQNRTREELHVRLRHMVELAERAGLDFEPGMAWKRKRKKV